MKNLGGGAARLRQINREMARQALLENGPLTRAGLSEVTGLSIATSANVLRDLVKDGEVFELGEKESIGGRPASKYALDTAHSMVVAVAAVASAEGDRLWYRVADSASAPVEEAWAGDTSDLAGITALLARLMQQYPAVKSAAVSIPGIVTDGVVGICDTAALEGVAIEAELRNKLGIEVAADNDVNLAAVGYYRERRDLEAASLAYIAFTCEMPAGAGLIVNGMLARGATGFAGEVSFIPLASGRRWKAPKDGDALKRYVADTAAAVIGVINPQVIVIGGQPVEDMTGAELTALCGETIPAPHLPEFVTCRDFAEDRAIGLVSTALDMLACEVRLVKKKRTWIDNG